MQTFTIPENSDIKQLILKLTCMSVSNIKWSCLFSGCGILNIITHKDIKKMLDESAANDDSVKALFDDLALLKCIYKKGSPSFSKPPAEIIDPGKYMWNFNSFTKTIEPSTQAMAVLSLTRAAKILYNEQKQFGIIMMKNAAVYYDFMTTYMRDDNGLFITVEDKTKHINEDLKIRQISKRIRLTDQLLVYEAFLQLYNATCETGFREYHSGDCKKYLLEARNILSYILENSADLVSQSSKNISTCISSLARCCDIETDSEMIENYKKLIIILCAEIETRIKMTGEVEKRSQSLETAEQITQFKIASSLMEGYFKTDIEKFKELSNKVYNNILTVFYDPDGIFSLSSSVKSSYNLRDITDIIKSLFMFSIIYNDRTAREKLISFYKTCFEKNGIVRSIPERKMVVLENEIVFDEDIPLISEIQKAPVFMKNIKIDNKSIPSISSSKHFCSLYALYASSMILFYMTPLIYSNNIKA